MTHPRPTPRSLRCVPSPRRTTPQPSTGCCACHPFIPTSNPHHSAAISRWNAKQPGAPAGVQPPVAPAAAEPTPPALDELKVRRNYRSYACTMFDLLASMLPAMLLLAAIDYVAWAEWWV